MRNDWNICQYCTKQSAITNLLLNACWNQMLLKPNQTLYLRTNNCIELTKCNLTLTSKKQKLKVLIYLYIFLLAYFLIRIFCSLLCSFVLYSIFFCNRFAFECFVPNVPNNSFWKHVPSKLLISLCWHTLHRI